MSLEDLILPKSLKQRYGLADSAESAESPTTSGLQSPPQKAGGGGELNGDEGFRTYQPKRADSAARASTGFQHNPHNPPESNEILEKPLPESRAALLQQGMELTVDDALFLQKHLPKGTACRNAAIRHYSRLWHQAMSAEPLPHKQQNRGRFTANSWLLATSTEGKQNDR